jgi:hypothetical protein
MLDGLTLHDNGVPIYVQLRDQLSALIGRLCSSGRRAVSRADSWGEIP